jgi:hypothetical protein
MENWDLKQEKSSLAKQNVIQIKLEKLCNFLETPYSSLGCVCLSTWGQVWFASA